MPRSSKEFISRKDFYSGAWKKNASKEENPVLKFLRENSNRAWKVQTIFKKIGFCESHVRTMLRDCIKQGLVDQDSPWNIFKTKKKRSKSPKKAKKTKQKSKRK